MRVLSPSSLVAQHSLRPIPLVFVLGCLLGVLATDVARAQDPVTTIENDRGTEVLQLLENGDLTLFENGRFTAPGIVESSTGFRLPDGTVLDESGDLGSSFSLPFSRTASSSNPLFELIQSGSGAAGFFDVANESSDADALTATTIGTGRAGEFKIFNAESNASALFAQTDGSGPAGTFKINNTDNGFAALRAESNGVGPAVEGIQSGTADPAILLSAPAGHFEIDNTDSPANALEAITNGSGAAVLGFADGTGANAGSFQIQNSASDAVALEAQTNGGGAAVLGITGGSGRAGYFEINNTSSGAEAFRAETNGASHAGVFEIDNTENDSSAVQGQTNGTGHAVEGIQRSPGGHAGHFDVNASGSEEAAVYAETNGTGPAVRGLQFGTAFDSSAHAGSFEIVNSNSDAEALLVRTNGSGEAVDAVQTGTGRHAHAGHFRIIEANNDASALRVATWGGGLATNTIASKSATVRDNPDGNVALIKNVSDQNGPDVLGLQAGPSNPGAGVNYLTFYDRTGTSVGAIEGNGDGGVSYKTSGADFAEELPVIEGQPKPQPKDLVGVHDGEVSLTTDGADRLMVITDRAAVLGNATPEAEVDDSWRVPVTFVGQVPVKVRGATEPGDWIVASGQGDGTARSVSPDGYRRARHGPIAGQAWSTKTRPEIGEVTVAVGLGHSDVVADQIEEQQDEIASLRNRVQTLEEMKARQAHLAEQVAALRAQQSGSALAGWSGSLLLAVLLGLGGFGAGVLWRQRA